MEQNYYVYIPDTGVVREIVGPEEVVVLLAEINIEWAIFFSGTGHLETTREPFVINKIA